MPSYPLNLRDQSPPSLRSWRFKINSPQTRNLPCDQPVYGKIACTPTTARDMSAALRGAHTLEKSLKLGAHMSIAGGYSKALDRANSIGCTAVQLFTKNASQWAAKPIVE